MSDVTFASMGLEPLILEALEKMEFQKPSSIQAAVIPKILQNLDLIALAKTGSGKTAACAIPICQKVSLESDHVQALIVVPTRELAMQYVVETQKIGKKKGVRAFVLCGGEDAEMQRSKLKSGVQVLVATPGRLIDFIYSRSIDLSHVSTLILDEADEMLSMGFVEDLEFIIQCLVHTHQTLLFSATMPQAIRTIAKSHMKNPEEINLLTHEKSPSAIKHYFHHCPPMQREKRLEQLIQEMQPKQAIIFCQSRLQCEKVCRSLKTQLPQTDWLHAGLSQEMRSLITSKFRQGKIQFLVATDVAARGLDFSQVTHVFIYELSKNIDTYVHRSGRTGRNEREGVVVTLVTDREISSLIRLVQKLKCQPLWLGKPLNLDRRK